MSTPKRGPIKVDLTGPDGKRKLDVEWDPFSQKYIVTVRDGKIYHWSATQFATYFRKWLLHQRGLPSCEVQKTSADSASRQ
jgi:hypothetical protein